MSGYTEALSSSSSGGKSIKGGDDYAVTTQTAGPINISAGNFFGSNFFPDPERREKLMLGAGALVVAAALAFGYLFKR